MASISRLNADTYFMHVLQTVTFTTLEVRNEVWSIIIIIIIIIIYLVLPTQLVELLAV